MKIIKIIISLMAAAVLLVSCGKDNGDNKGGENSGVKVSASTIAGDWNLTGISTKAATLGGQTIDVYLRLSSGNTFELYQMLGDGRYRYASGSWSLSGTTLSGTYTDGTAWGSSYGVELSSDGNTMTLTGSGSSISEVDTYTKRSIPSSVTENAIGVGD